MTSSRRSLRSIAIAALATASVVATGTAQPSTADAATAKPPGITATAAQATSCGSLYRKAHRYRRGSAKRRKYLRRYRSCRRSEQQTGSAPTPSYTPPVQEQAPTVVFHNPNGYVSGQGCLRSWEATFNSAGFSCQFSGLYQQVYLYPAGWVSNPIYILYPLCADGSGRIC